MSTFDAMEIAASGLSVQRTRMSLVASNLANVHSTRDPEFNGPYRRRELVVQAVPVSEFDALLRERLGTESSEIESVLRGVEVASVAVDGAMPQMVYNPGHPDADDQGYVAMPNISVMREMTDMMAAARAYEANLATLRTVRDMAQSSLDIMRG